MDSRLGTREHRHDDHRWVPEVTDRLPGLMPPGYKAIVDDLVVQVRRLQSAGTGGVTQTAATPRIQQMHVQYASGSGTLSGFYDEAVGTRFIVSIDHSSQFTFIDGQPPQFLDSEGNDLRGALVFLSCANLDGGRFTVVFERVSADSYEPLTGDLDYTWRRPGLT